MKTCTTHACKLSETKVTSTKWEYIERKKCYGNVRRKVTRWICRGKNSRLTVHTISTSAKSTDSRVTRGQISESSGDLHNLLEQNNETGWAMCRLVLLELISNLFDFWSTVCIWPLLCWQMQYLLSRQGTEINPKVLEIN